MPIGNYFQETLFLEDHAQLSIPFRSVGIWCVRTFCPHLPSLASFLLRSAALQWIFSLSLASSTSISLHATTQVGVVERTIGAVDVEILNRTAPITRSALLLELWVQIEWPTRDGECWMSRAEQRALVTSFLERCWWNRMGWGPTRQDTAACYGSHINCR